MSRGTKTAPLDSPSGGTLRSCHFYETIFSVLANSAAGNTHLLRNLLVSVGRVLSSERVRSGKAVFPNRNLRFWEIRGSFGKVDTTRFSIFSRRGFRLFWGDRKCRKKRREGKGKARRRNLVANYARRCRGDARRSCSRRAFDSHIREIPRSCPFSFKFR